VEALMKCIECGTPTTEQVADRELKLDLPYHVVAKDAPAHICPNCGATYFGMKAPASTMRSLAEWIARRAGRLHGTEVRFIRHAMGWSQEQLGLRLGVAVETVSRWENSKKPVGYQSELALRFLVIVGSQVAEDLDRSQDPPVRVDVFDQEVVAIAG